VAGVLLLCFFKKTKDKKNEKAVNEIKELNKEENEIKQILEDVDKTIEESSIKDKELENKVNSWLEKLDQYKKNLIILIFSTCLFFCNNVQAITPEELLEEAEIIILEQQEQIREKNKIITSLQEENTKLLSLLDSYKQLTNKLSKQQKQHGIAIEMNITFLSQPRLNVKYVYKKTWFSFYTGLSTRLEPCAGFIIWVK